MKTNTPETDAHQAIDGMAYDHSWREFARNLERERDALKSAINEAIIELTPRARPAHCRSILRVALGQDPLQIYNSENV